jgi:hypothetical protein
MGSLYMRTFASKYPKQTAAVVLWDPLPSQERSITAGKFTPSSAANLPPFLLTLCTYYLEPMGIVDLFMQPMLIMPLFNGTALAKPKAAGGIGVSPCPLKNKGAIKALPPPLTACLDA